MNLSSKDIQEYIDRLSVKPHTPQRTFALYGLRQTLVDNHAGDKLASKVEELIARSRVRTLEQRIMARANRRNNV